MNFQKRVKNTVKIFISTFLYFVLMPFASFAQQPCTLCDAVNTANFNKVERIVKKKILKHRYGHHITNANSSYTSYSAAYDSIVRWLSEKECVSAATWDKCEIKISIYPGHSAIGAIFKTPKGEVEKIFLLREGKGGRHLFKKRERLYYLEMKDSKGFAKKQFDLCDAETNRRILSGEIADPAEVHETEEIIPYENLLGTFVSADFRTVKDTISFRFDEENKVVWLTRTRTSDKQERYVFRSLEPGMITAIGDFSRWQIQIAKVEILLPDRIKILYSTTYDFKQAVWVLYDKIRN